MPLTSFGAHTLACQNVSLRVIQNDILALCFCGSLKYAAAFAVATVFFDCFFVLFSVCPYFLFL